MTSRPGRQVQQVKPCLVVGDANVDLLCRGLRSMPVLGREIECAELRMVLGGSAANCAVWLASLGLPVDFWGRVGRDAFGDFAVGEMHAAGVGLLPGMQDPDWKTGACASLVCGGDRALVSFLGSITGLRLELLPLERISGYRHLHSGSLFIQHGLRSGFVKLFRAAKQAGLFTSLDCGWDPLDRWDIDLEELLPYVDDFLPNEAEALRLTRASTAEEAAAELAHLGRTIVIKLGAQGAMAQHGRHSWHSPAFNIEVVDSTGAGDAFNAGWIYARSGLGLPIPGALKFANACGALRTAGESQAPASAVLNWMDRQPG